MMEKICAGCRIVIQVSRRATDYCSACSAERLLEAREGLRALRSLPLLMKATIQACQQPLERRGEGCTGKYVLFFTGQTCCPFCMSEARRRGEDCPQPPQKKPRKEKPHLRQPVEQLVALTASPARRAGQ